MLHIKSHLSYLLKFAEQFNLQFLLGEIKVLIDLIKYTYFSELSYYSMKKVKVRLGPARLLCPWGFSWKEHWSG